MRSVLQKTLFANLAAGFAMAALFFVLDLVGMFRGVPPKISKFEELFLGAGCAVIFLALGWACARAVRGGRPLTLAIRKILLYGFSFVLGVAYILMFGSWLAWPTPVRFVLIAAWGVLLALAARWPHVHQSRGTQGPFTPEL